MDKPSIEQSVRDMLVAIGEDPDREGLRETPRRIADMYEEIFSGMHEDPSVLLEVGFDDEDHHEMVVVKDIPFYSMCVPSKQLVDVVGGQRPAATVRVGDWLYTFVQGRLTTTRVVAHSRRSTRDLVMVKPSASAAIFLTPEHPVMTPEGWVPAGALRRGDMIEWMHPRRYAQRRYPVREGYHLGYALGAIAADGSIQDGRRISLCVRSREFAQRFADAAAAALGIAPRVESVAVPSGYLGRPVPTFRVRIVSRYLAGLMLRWFRCGGKTKGTREFQLPSPVLGTREMTQGFLDGYIDGDGDVLKQTGRMVISANARFLTQLGAVVGAKPAPALSGVSRLYISNRWHKAGWFGRPGFIPRPEPYDLQDSQYVRLEKVEGRQATGRKPYTVYTFTCDPHPTFAISGILTHNCEHHLLPFHGVAHVGYIPRGRILGISKVARLVEMLARRPQVQERLTSQVADFLCEGGLNAQGAAVVIQAEHLCITMRGAKKPGSRVVTSATRGVFREDPRTRAEFFAIVEGK